MKILQFGKFYPPVFGGIENVMYEITTGLNTKSGVKCDVLCSNNNNSFSITKHSSYKIIRTKSYGKYFSTSISPQLITKLSEIQSSYDVISVHFPDPMAAIALFIARPKAKIVIHWHSDIIKQKFLLKLFNPLQSWVVNRADLVLGATKSHINGSDKCAKIKEKSRVIPYPFDSSALKENTNNVLFEALQKKFSNKVVIFSIGRLVYYKGFRYLIEAASNLNNNHVILIGGEGILDKELQDQIDSNGLNDKVVLLGGISQKDLSAYYQLCDIFCLPSIFRTEMFGIVQLESMSFGKPVISTKLDRSGVCNVNINGETGVCVEIKNSFQIASAIKEMTQDKYKYERYSSNCVKRVEEVYKKEIIIDKIIDMYNDLLNS
jgi:glycosyltransferase involved in cell wall biosynthesis